VTGAIRDVRFRVGFDMSSEYDVTFDDWRTIRVKVRIGAHTCNTRSDYIDAVKGTIGTVMLDDRAATRSFPPAIVVEHFAREYGIPLVGARWGATWAVEYDGDPPAAPVAAWPWRDGTEYTWVHPIYLAKCEVDRAARRGAA
jgi:hypothetical protein